MGGSLTENEIYSICSYCKVKPDTFIETGTYLGDTTLLASKIFAFVITMEISDNLYQHSLQRFASYRNISALLGDSVELLKDIVPHTLSAFYFLDAHQSGCDTSNNGTWVPLLTELDIIIPYITCHTIIVIDDVRLFDGPWDWKGITVNDIIQKLPNVSRYKVENDRLIICFQ